MALRRAGLSFGWAVPMPAVAWVMVLAVFQLAGAGTSPSPNGQQRCGSKPPEVGLGPWRPVCRRWAAGPGEDDSLPPFLCSLLRLTGVASSNSSLKKYINSGTIVCEAAAPSKTSEI